MMTETMTMTVPKSQRRRNEQTVKIETIPKPLRVLKMVVLAVLAAIMLVPLYILVISAFKPASEILNNPLGFNLGTLTPEYLFKAMTTENFNVISAYGITLFFVVMVNLFCTVIAAPVSYVIARGQRKWHLAFLVFFLTGLFVPGQVTLIPTVFVLRSVGLIGTIPGYLIMVVAHMLPVTIFLFSAYIRTIPREIDEAASIDGAGKMRAFWSTIFPLMMPVVITMIVLHSISVWNDYIGPQIILGPSSGIYTVTTGVFAAVSQYSTDYTIVFPTLLLAIAPALIFFVIMQRTIVGGLIAGATKA